MAELDNRRIVQSVKRALEILEAVAVRADTGGITLSELSETVDLNKNTVYQLLSTLIVMGYVEQNPTTKRYLIGYGVVRVAEMGNYRSEMGARFQPLLHEMAELTGETSHIAVLNKGQVQFLAKQEGSCAFRVNTDLAELMPVHCSSVGKALIAFLPDEQLGEFIDRHIDYKPFAKNTIADKRTLLKDLEGCRERGYAIDDEESFDGVICVASPIFNIRRTVIAAIGISAPAIRVRNIDALGRITEKFAYKVSNTFGYFAGE